MNISKEDLKAQILFKLVRRRMWGGKHTAYEHALRGLPGHLIGEAKETLDELIKEDFILSKRTNYGLQISLNVNKKSEIEKLIGENI